MLSPSELKFVQTYKPELQKAKWKFIVAYGLAFGLLQFSFTLAYDYFFTAEVFTAKAVLVRLVIVLVGSLCYGLWFRWYVERRVKKLESKNAAA